MKRSDDLSRDVPFDEHDPVWRLMGGAPLAEPDAWFAARTLARCRSEGRSALSFLRFSPMWRWAVGGGLGVCLAVGLLVAQMHAEQVDKQKNVQEAFEIMASIDTDPDSSFSSSTSSSSSSWQDSSL
jgi:hypothetical protein